MKKLLPKSEKIAQWPSDGRKINIKKIQYVYIHHFLKVGNSMMWKKAIDDPSKTLTVMQNFAATVNV